MLFPKPAFLLLLLLLPPSFVTAQPCRANSDCDTTEGEWCGSCGDGDQCCPGPCIISEASAHSCLDCSKAFNVPFNITQDCNCLAADDDEDLRNCNDLLSSVKFPGCCSVHTDCDKGAWYGFHEIGMATTTAWSTCSSSSNATTTCNHTVAVGNTCLDCGPPFYTRDAIRLAEDCQCLIPDTALDDCSAYFVETTSSAAMHGTMALLVLSTGGCRLLLAGLVFV